MIAIALFTTELSIFFINVEFYREASAKISF